MRYIVTLTIHGKRKAFKTDEFDAENHFIHTAKMTVVDTDLDLYTVDGVTWELLEGDSL